MASRRGLSRCLSLGWKVPITRAFGLPLSTQSFESLPARATNAQSQVWTSKQCALGLGIATAGTAGLLAGSTDSWPHSMSLAKLMNAPGVCSLPFCTHVAEARSHSPHVTPGTLPSLTLYQYEVCPFCCKVKAFLDYHKIPYEIVEVNPVTKSELSWSSYKKVPVIKLGEEQVNGSDVIISRIADELEGKTKKSWRGSGLLQSADHSAEEEKWRNWVDEKYVKTLTANIYRNWGESWQAFDYITQHGNFGAVGTQVARVFGSVTMWAIAKRMPKKYNIEGDLREALFKQSNEWVDAIGRKPFKGGDHPNLADLAVFGVLRAIIGTPTFTDVMENSKILPWYTRMADAVGNTSRSVPSVA